MTATMTPIKVKSVRCSAGTYELTVQDDTFVLTSADPDYPVEPGYEWLLEGDEVEEYFTRKRDAIAWLQEQYEKKRKQVPNVAYYWHQGNLRESGDCALRAIEHVTGIGYKLSQRRALEHGYRRGEGMTAVETACCLEQVACKPIATFLGPKSLPEGITVTDFAAQYSGTWILFVKEHAIGLVDGKLDGEFTYENLPVKVAMGWGEKR